MMIKQWAQVRIPRTIKCDQCGNPFEVVDEQTTCTQCLIRPRRSIDFPTIPIQEAIMPDALVVRSEKICIECNNPFKPTGNCQKRCEKCRKSASHHTDVREKKRTLVKRDILTAEHPLGDTLAPAAETTATAKAFAFAAKRGYGITPVESQFAAFVRTLHDAGVTSIVFGSVKITIEQV
jgi:Zn finger protein HypA/HybF involved in hydrogenase expression